MIFKRVAAEEAFAYKIQQQDEKDKKQIRVVVNDFLSEQIVAAYKLLSSDDSEGNNPSYLIFIISLPKRMEMTFIPRYGNDQKKLSVFLLNPRKKMLAWVDKQLQNYPNNLYEEQDDFYCNLEFHFAGNESSWPFQEFLSSIKKMPALISPKKTEDLKNNDKSGHLSYGGYFGL